MNIATVPPGKERVTCYSKKLRTRQATHTYYICPYCKSNIETKFPAKKEVTAIGYLSSLKICSECSRKSLVFVYPTGKTYAKTL
jgi:hypothetical protein